MRAPTADQHWSVSGPREWWTVTPSSTKSSEGDTGGKAQMNNIDSTYVGIGALWLLLGMIIGIVMGARQDFQYMPVHAHINLVGFACHAIFGMAYRHWPTMKSSTLAPYQFWIFVVATPVTLVGLYFTLSGGPELPTIIGSLGLLAATALFCLMIWQARGAG
jgi:hypothetical protein